MEKTAAFLRDCSFHERLMLAALLKCVKKEGVDEIKWSDVSLTGPLVCVISILTRCRCNINTIFT